MVYKLTSFTDKGGPHKVGEMSVNEVSSCQFIKSVSKKKKKKEKKKKNY
jgi:hypothetical protein